MLEFVKIEAALRQGRVLRRIVCEIFQLDVDTLFLRLFLEYFPLRVIRAYDPYHYRVVF